MTGNCSKKYYLYINEHLVKQTGSIDYAFFWILNNFINSPNTNLHIDIVNTQLDDFPFESIKIVNNRLVKYNNLVESNNNILTIYSPYDMDYFNKLELSLLYQKIYNKTHLQTSQPTQTQPTQPTQTQPTQPIQTQPIQTQPIQTQQTQTQSQLINNSEYNNMTSDEIKKMITILEKEKADVEKNIKKREEEWMDNDCNIKFDKMQLRKREERLKEKYNIFLNDINIYNKLKAEENFSEDFIPHLFCAKYYILKYLFTNNYFDNEDINKPSEELFTLYRFLYVYLNKYNTDDDNQKDTIDNDLELKKKNDKHHEDNDFDDIDSTYNDIFNEFIDFLPNDREIITDKHIMKNINIKGDNDMFKEKTGYESDLNSDTESDTNSDTNSDTKSELEEDIENKSIDSEYIENELINDFKKSIENYRLLIKENQNPSNDFIDKYNIIKYLFKFGHLDLTDLEESINDCVYLYELLNDILNKKNIPTEIIDAFDEDIKEFKNFMIQ